MELSLDTNQAHPDRQQKYHTEIDAIVGQALTPESIDTYADEALERLIEVIGRATDDYSRQPTLRFEAASDTENATFGYYDLQNVELLLDTIADKADELHLIDDLIARTSSVNEILLPPDLRKPAGIERGNGTVEKKKLIPKLKTLLFVASNDFNVNITDPDQLRLTSGALPETMMRGQSYYHVEFPMLHRSVFICDEAENITFLFDDLALKKYEMTSLELTALTKSDIKALISDDPSLGRQLVYTKHFIPHLIDALEDPATRPQARAEVNPEEPAGSYLYPKAPEGFMSATGLGRVWQIASDTINSAVVELSDTIGEVNRYKFSQKAVGGYSPEQQAILHQYFEAKGAFSEAAPEDHMTAKGLSRLWEVSDTSIYKALKELGDTIGEVHTYKFGRQVFPGYTPEQQAQIRLQLEAQGTFAAAVPEGYTSEAGLRAEWGINTVTINKAIKELGDSLGDLIYYRFGNMRTIGYSPEQQEIIRQYLEAKGNFNDKAPEGYISVRGMADSWELSFGVVNRVVDELTERLGTVDQYKFGRSNILAAAYNPEQQSIIRRRLEEKGMFCEQPPEGYYSAANLGLMWKGVGQAAVYKAIEHLSDSLGEVRLYKFTSRVVYGYSPAQQELIKQYLVTQQNKVIY
jgi:hypothetical protein